MTSATRDDADAGRKVSGIAAWASFLLALAATYNLFWGAVVVLAPGWSIELLGLKAGANLPLVQCIGMLVGVYGVAYWIASTDPARYWPLVLVGLIGKVLGPFGGVWAVWRGELPAAILVVNLFNDLIWWLPFAWILYGVHSGALSFAAPPVSGQSLYRSLLGSRFDRLDPQLRRFHDAGSPIEVDGHFRVVRGAGALRHWIADLEGFPPATDSVAVHLRVEPRGDRERWHRTFGTSTLISEQWSSGGLLVERLGRATLYMKPRVEDGALAIDSVRATVLGFPLPPICAPYVAARGRDIEGGMRISVRLGIAPLGTLVEYSGVVSILEPGASSDGREDAQSESRKRIHHDSL